MSRRWYDTALRGHEFLGRVQIEQALREGTARIPEEILRMAYAEYATQQGSRQSFEDIQNRGGFGVLEVVLLLADAIDREREPPR